MATNTLTGGAFQGADGKPLIDGYLIFELNQDGQVGTTALCFGTKVQINLDASGNVIAAQNIWPNDQIIPSGTFYTVTAYTQANQPVWGPHIQQVPSSPSPFNVGTWIPNQLIFETT